MTDISVSTESTVAAPAERVYRILADYERHHPHILPPAIHDLVVEEGGVGEGTVIRFQTTLGGRTQRYRARIGEPEPGKTLQEDDLERDLVTTFTVTPEGSESRVRIESMWSTPGLRGIVERLLAPRMLRAVYAEELLRLNRYAAEHPEI
jgi:hypothetical protein